MTSCTGKMACLFWIRALYPFLTHALENTNHLSTHGDTLPFWWLLPCPAWWISWKQSIYLFNTLRPRQNGRRFPDDIFKCIFFNENYEFRLKFHCSLFLGAQLTMVQVIAWYRPRDKPLSEPMIISLPAHICVTRPQWVNVIWDNSLALRRHKRVILLSDKENPQPISSAW